MPAVWTISHEGGAFLPAEDLAITVASREASNMAADEVTLEHAGAMDAGPSGWAAGHTIRIRRNGQPYFTGTLSEDPRQGDGTAESVAYTLQGPWWWLTETYYLQSRNSRGPLDAADTPVENSRVLLNTDSAGASISTAAQISAILAYAISASGPFQAGVVDLPAITPLATTANDITCAEAIRRQLAYHPDAVVHADHSTDPPTLHVRAASSLATITQPVDGTASGGNATTGFSIRLAASRKPPCVAIFYERLHERDDDVFREIIRDIHPALGNPRARGAIVATIKLQGSRTLTQKQPVTTRSYPKTVEDCETASGRKWWASHEPDLDLIRDTLEFDAVTATLADADPPAPPETVNPAATPLRAPGLAVADLPRELVDGHLAEWMDVQAAGVTLSARVAAPLTAVQNPALPEPLRARLAALLPERITPGSGVVWAAGTLAVSFQATDAFTRNYTRVSGYTPAETAPTGIAATVYAALAADAFAGKITLCNAEAGGVQWLGKRISFTGQRAEWAAAAMPVQSVSEDLQNGRTTLTFGPPNHLGPTDLVSILQAMRGRETIHRFDQSQAKHRDDAATIIGPAATPFEKTARIPTPGPDININISHHGENSSNKIMPRSALKTIFIRGGRVIGTLDQNLAAVVDHLAEYETAKPAGTIELAVTNTVPAS